MGWIPGAGQDPPISLGIQFLPLIGYNPDNYE
jgi:hypothetical protein